MENVVILAFCNCHHRLRHFFYLRLFWFEMALSIASTRRIVSSANSFVLYAPKPFIRIANTAKHKHSNDLERSTGAGASFHADAAPAISTIADNNSLILIRFLFREARRFLPTTRRDR